MEYGDGKSQDYTNSYTKKNCAKVHILIGNYITRKIATKYAVVKVLAGALLWHFGVDYLRFKEN